MIDIVLPLVFGGGFIYFGWKLYNKGGTLRVMAGAVLMGFGAVGVISVFFGY